MTPCNDSHENNSSEPSKTTLRHDFGEKWENPLKKSPPLGIIDVDKPVWSPIKTLRQTFSVATPGAKLHMQPPPSHQLRLPFPFSSRGLQPWHSALACPKSILGFDSCQQAMISSITGMLDCSHDLPVAQCLILDGVEILGTQLIGQSSCEKQFTSFGSWFHRFSTYNSFCPWSH